MHTFAVDSTFAGHVIRCEIGRGGMGVVYRATHIALKRDVALKVISPRVGSDESFRERFRREAEAAAAIQHPNVVPVFDAGEQDGFLYVTMRFVEGDDLGHVLRAEGQIAPERAVRLVGQIADALDAAHALGIVHRDVKPANVLIEGEGLAERALLTDFGLTKHIHSETGLTETGAVLGTIDYAAPELLDGSAVDLRTDVYALGCVLYELLIGQVPYPRNGIPARIFAHLEAPLPSISTQLPDAPPALEGVIQRAMSKLPEDRYASAGELGRAALEALDPEAVTEISPAPAKAKTAAPKPPRDPDRPGRRRRRQVLALTALGVVAGVAVGMLTLGDKGPRREPNEANAASAATPTSTPAPTVSAADYQARVVKVCQRVNSAERAHRRANTTLSRRLKNARTIAQQRDAIMVATRSAISRGGSNLAALLSLEPPEASRALQAETAKVWDRSLDRTRAYAVRLDEVTTRKGLLKAIRPLTKARATAQEDAVTLVSNLQRLGGSECEIIRFSERPVPLPPLRASTKPGPDTSAAAPQRPSTTQPPSAAGPQPTAAPSRPDTAPQTAKPPPPAPDTSPGNGVSAGGEG